MNPPLEIGGFDDKASLQPAAYKTLTLCSVYVNGKWSAIRIVWCELNLTTVHIQSDIIYGSWDNPI